MNTLSMRCAGSGSGGNGDGKSTETQAKRQQGRGTKAEAKRYRCAYWPTDVLTYPPSNSHVNTHQLIHTHSLSLVYRRVSQSTTIRPNARLTRDEKRIYRESKIKRQEKFGKKHTHTQVTAKPLVSSTNHINQTENQTTKKRADEVRLVGWLDWLADKLIILK